MLQYIRDLVNAFVLKSLKRVYFWHGANVLVMIVVVLNALGTQRLDAGHCSTKIRKGLAVMLRTSIFYQLR